MGITFNPFTGTLDFTGAGGGGTGTPALPFTSVQFNDGGSFGGDANFTWDKTTGALALSFGGPPTVTLNAGLGSVDASGDIAGATVFSQNAVHAPGVTTAGSFATVTLTTDGGTLAVDGTSGMVHISDAIEGVAITAPGAGAANSWRLYAQDNGGGKTQLMIQFATGAAQQLAVQA